MSERERENKQNKEIWERDTGRGRELAASVAVSFRQEKRQTDTDTKAV